MSRLGPARPAALPACLLLALWACGSPPPVVDAVSLEAACDPEELLARALALLKAVRFEKCAAIAEHLLDSHEDFAKTETVLFLAAEARYRLGDMQAALAHYRRLVNDFPCTRAHAAVADRLYHAGAALLDDPPPLLGGLLRDRQPGIEALGYLVVHYPGSPLAEQGWLRLGEAHLAEGQYDLAAEAYERLLRRYPDSALKDEVLFRVASVHRAQSKGAAYDREPLLRAWFAADRYLKCCGASGRYAAAALAMKEAVARDVALSESEIAEFYQRRGAQQAARWHHENAALELQDDATDLLRPHCERPPWKTGPDLLPFWAAGSP
ncbi:MAG: tetratricopeptide repeat protein [Planctomycetes bacterium]|nr:tetratricopeptide repeat protein [Planctomycetota bacterium]